MKIGIYGVSRWCVALAIWFLTGTSTALGGPTAPDLVIGQVAPLSGVLASTGRQMVVGGRIYFDWINDRGGVHGAKLRQVVMDDGYEVEKSVQQTRSLLAQPDVVALFGFAGTANVARLLSEGVLAQGGAALVAPYTGGEPLRSPFNPWIFHVRAGYADEAEHLVQHLVTLGVKRIGVMYQDDAFGHAGRMGVEAALTKRNLELAVSASYARNTDEVSAAVNAIRHSDAQAVVMISINKPTAAFIKRYREAGGRAQLYNISVVDPNELVALAGLKNAQGLGISQVVPYPYTANLSVIREYHELLKKYAPGEAVNYTSFEQFLGAKVLVEGLRRAGPRPTRSRVVAALESMQAYDLGGIEIHYAPDQRVGSRYVEVTLIGSSGKLLK